MVSLGLGSIMNGGTYVLELAVDRPLDLEVGALGNIQLETGTYAYVGSALGPGGFARIDRHRAVAAGERDVRHWHIDYLLEVATLSATHRLPEVTLECELAHMLVGSVVEGFGASDCECPGHLLQTDSAAIQRAIEALCRDHPSERCTERYD